MTIFSFLWLVLSGAAIQRVAGPTYRGHALDITMHEIVVFVSVLGGLWLVLVAEVLWLVLQRGPGRSAWNIIRNEFWPALLPPLRMVSRVRAMNGQIWFPVLGWRPVTRELRQKLERFFSVPMIVVALMILPVLIVEHYWGDSLKQDENVWTLIVLDSCTVVIWLAFATEFIVMCAVADKRFAYCKTHWLDMAIILLPMISFARAIQLVWLIRLGRMSRLYRLRGLMIRAFRALLLLDLIARLIGQAPEKRLAKLQEMLAEKEADAADLRKEILRLEMLIAQRASEKAAAASDAASKTNEQPTARVRDAVNPTESAQVS